MSVCVICGEPEQSVFCVTSGGVALPPDSTCQGCGFAAGFHRVSRQRGSLEVRTWFRWRVVATFHHDRRAKPAGEQ